MIIAVSVVVRLLLAFYLGNTVEPVSGAFDQVSYHALAQRVVNGFGFTFGEPWWPATAPNTPTAHWSYLYTIYLAIIYWVLGPDPLLARVIQAVIVGILQPYLVFQLGKRVFDPFVGIVAAALTSLYAYFIFYSGTLMTEPFYIVAILTSLYAAIRLVDSLSPSVRELKARSPILWSFMLATSLITAIHLRQLFLLIVPFIFLWVLVATKLQGGQVKSAIGALSAVTLAIVTTILPITYSNYQRFDRFVLLNTNAGYAFFWGNHPIYGTRFIPILSEYQSLLPKELLHLDEAALDTALLKIAIGFIRDDPQRYLLLSLSRIPIYFTFWPSAESGLINNLSRVLSFGLLLPFMIYGVFRAWVKPSSLDRTWLSSPKILLLLFGIVYSGIHFLTWTLIRYRLPVDAVLVVFAGVGIVDIANRLIEEEVARPPILLGRSNNL